ncbi:hypothetical protein [Kistimonas asteriae]|uniref:hypothetical protein n=1 Tax=Kistimonas asteriae TaxID=517724 RepID=UPI001BA4CE12|nr:hypothetical protein [Kistimonas asteriae]
MVQKQAPFIRLSGITLMLLQTLWCGGIWIVAYLVNPVLVQAGGRYPDIVIMLSQVMIGLALVCTGIVLAFCLAERGFKALRYAYEKLLAAVMAAQAIGFIGLVYLPAMIDVFLAVIALLAVFVVIYSVQHLREEKG